MLHILLNLIICVMDIQRINNSRWNVQFNIWYHDKISYNVKLHHFWSHVWNIFVSTIFVRVDIINPYIILNRTQIFVKKLSGFIIILDPRFTRNNLNIVVILFQNTNYNYHISTFMFFINSHVKSIS